MWHKEQGHPAVQIDVEGMELDVLQGVGAAAWPLVRQAAVEVHDVGARVAAVQALLREAGFARVTVAQGLAPRTRMVTAQR